MEHQMDGQRKPLLPAFPERSHNCAQQGVRVLLVDLEQLERPGSLVAACMFRKYEDFRS